MSLKPSPKAKTVKQIARELYTTSPEKAAYLTKLLSRYRGTTDAKTQREIILEALGKHGLITYELRRLLDSASCAARIFELKRIHGYTIKTVKVWTQSECGRIRWQAMYVLDSADNAVVQ